LIYRIKIKKYVADFTDLTDFFISIYPRKSAVKKGGIMKKIGLVVLMLFVIYSLFAQPKIEFDTMTHEFGDIKEDEGPYEIDFNFTNTGDEPLKLIKVKAG